jgi:EAL domain-containing protein (putative c-di-GMP-specific phosphodiesterase class I)
LALTRSSISLAHSLRLRVIAEGMETEARRALLREPGCDLAQGYPVLSAEQLASFLREREGTVPPPGSC